MLSNNTGAPLHPTRDDGMYHKWFSKGAPVLGDSEPGRQDAALATCKTSQGERNGDSVDVGPWQGFDQQEGRNSRLRCLMQYVVAGMSGSSCSVHKNIFLVLVGLVLVKAAVDIIVKAMVGLIYSVAVFLCVLYTVGHIVRVYVFNQSQL